MIKIFLTFFIIWTYNEMQAQTLFTSIKTHQFEQIDSLQNTQKRNILVFIHADWCKYCQHMKITTFKDESIIKMINDKFYLIDFNAEYRRNIKFNKHTFKFKPTGIYTGTHELAEQLGTVGSMLSYPTLCFLNSDNEIIFQYTQFINSKNLQIILNRLNQTPGVEE